MQLFPPKLDLNKGSLEMAKILEVSFAICTCTSSNIFHSFFLSPLDLISYSAP